MHLNIGVFILIGWAVIALIQIFYSLYYFIKVGLHKDELDNISAKPFSIIICAKNERKNIQANIEQWCTQDYKDAYGRLNYEVLLVDDLSDDGSHYLYPDLQNRFPHLRILILRQEAKGIPGKKFALSMGIKEAKFDNLLLTDADCRPASEQWLSHISKTYNKDTEIVLGYSPFEKESGFLNKWQRWETLHTAMQYFGFALRRMPYMGVGRNLSYNRSLFNANKGFSKFHHIASGDDDLFVNQVATKNNTRVVLSPESYTWSKAKSNYEAWWFQKTRHLSTAKYYKAQPKFLLGLYSISHTLFWLLLPLVIFLNITAAKLMIAVVTIFLLRNIIHWAVAGIAAKRLGENDLIKWIPFFDIVTLYYNFRLLPSYFKNPTKWK
jgi:glycosyltransferase involved in cell wall biosynthesis